MVRVNVDKEYGLKFKTVEDFASWLAGVIYTPNNSTLAVPAKNDKPLPAEAGLMTGIVSHPDKYNTI